MNLVRTSSVWWGYFTSWSFISRHHLRSHQDRHYVVVATFHFQPIVSIVRDLTNLNALTSLNTLRTIIPTIHQCAANYFRRIRFQRNSPLGGTSGSDGDLVAMVTRSRGNIGGVLGFAPVCTVGWSCASRKGSDWMIVGSWSVYGHRAKDTLWFYYFWYAGCQWLNCQQKQLPLAAQTTIT